MNAKNRTTTLQDAGLISLLGMVVFTLFSARALRSGEEALPRHSRAAFDVTAAT
jgi:hypothetical protein